MSAHGDIRALDDATLRYAIRQRAERFWSRVERSDSCWRWLGGLDTDGYGRFFICIGHGPNRLAYEVKAARAAWYLTREEPIVGLEVLHHCDEPSCVRPDHLARGTHAANMADKVSKGRQQRGERVPGSKLRVDALIDIARRVVERGESQAAVARRHRISASTVHCFLSGRTWRCARESVLLQVPALAEWRPRQ